MLFRSADGDWLGAERDYRAAIERAGGSHAAAQNNLAMVLLERGCAAESLVEANAALASLAPGDPLAESVSDTARQAQERLAAGDRCR